MQWFGCILLQGGKSFNYLNFIYVTISCTSQNYYFQKSIVFQMLSSEKTKTKIYQVESTYNIGRSFCFSLRVRQEFVRQQWELWYSFPPSHHPS